MSQVNFDYIRPSVVCSVPRMNTLADRIRTARKRVPGLTQAKIGDAAGVSAQAVNMWENGKSRPTRENLAVVARMTGVTTDWLITGTELSEPINARTIDAFRVSGRAVAMISVEQALTGLSEGVDAPLINVVFPCGPNSYAVVMPNDSNSPQFPKGSILVFDPDADREPERLVFAAFNGKPVFGHLNYENGPSGPIEIVRPSRPGWPEARSDAGTLVVRAVLTEAAIRG